MLDKIVYYILTHSSPRLWQLGPARVAFLQRKINVFLINRDILSLRPRPYTLSTMVALVRLGPR